MSRPTVIACMFSSSDSWELQQHPRLWHSRAGGGAVHSIRSGHMQRTRHVRFRVTADIAASATHRKAKLILPIIQIATAATSPALTNTPDTTAALNRITPNAYAILS